MQGAEKPKLVQQMDMLFLVYCEITVNTYLKTLT